MSSNRIPERLLHMSEGDRKIVKKKRDTEEQKIKKNGYDLTSLYVKAKEETEKDAMNVDPIKDIALVEILSDLKDTLTKYLNWLDEEVQWDAVRQYELPWQLREPRYGSSQYGEIVPHINLRETISSTMSAYRDTLTKLHYANKVLQLKKRAEIEKLVSFRCGRDIIYLKYVSTLSEVQDSRQIVNKGYVNDPFLIGATDRNDCTVGELKQFLIGYKNKQLLGCNGNHIDLYFAISPLLNVPRPGRQRETSVPKILLEDDRTLASYGITDHMAIHVVCN